MYKIGDKVEYLNNVWEVCDWEIDSVEIYNEKMGVNIYVPIDDVIPYRTAHDKLLAMGYRFWDNSNGLQYNKGNIEILIDKEEKVYKVYWMVDYQAYDVDLELSRILTQYLEELEK